MGGALARSLHSANSKIRRHRTETTTSTISEGTPEMSMMVIGLPWTGMRRMRDNTWAMVSCTVRRENMNS